MFTKKGLKLKSDDILSNLESENCFQTTSISQNPKV